MPYIPAEDRPALDIAIEALAAAINESGETTYDDLAKDRESLLGLKAKDHFFEFLKSLK